jgi:flagellar assembly protein FliH
MKSYSKIFKASNLFLMDEVKVIKQPFIPIKLSSREMKASGNHDEHEAVSDISDYHQMVKPNEKAHSIIEMAKEKARAIEADATAKINQWWDENQKKLEAMALEAKEQGYQDGFSIGKQEAQEQIRHEYLEKIAQANQVLEQAYGQKEAIILEAEPFLLELSTTIASQIIKQELTDYPDKFVELIKQHILRFKEKEYITVCVHPDDYEFIQSQRAHLIAIVNGETEIKIIPDPSVSAKGCIIRTAYGSVDARIDTQIEEIKKVILEARRRERESEINS